ncbi:hypothetical protein H0H93_010474 [Arthromyces matolae]|nr:hypothetical protein H0H93_010474 [Arthromyces matolae]
MRRPSHVRPYQGYPWFRLPSQKSFPFLEKVDLDLPFRDALAFLQPAIESTPRLRDITLAGAPPSLLTVLPHTTLGQLTDLRTTSVESLQECCEILNLSPRLRNCRFDLDFQPHTTPPGLLSPIIHHDLDKLYVGPTDLGVFFNSVTLPALRTLSINLKDSPQRGKWGQQSFIDFLGRSHCSLTKLSLYNINITAAHLIECLETVSRTLVELHIDRGQTKFITPMVVGALTFSELNSPLCPLLERIRIRGHIFDEEVSGAAMVHMVESRFRRDSSSRLRWACIGGCYDENDWKKIRDLQRVGLALTISEKDFNGSDPGLFDCIVF